MNKILSPVFGGSRKKKDCKVKDAILEISLEEGKFSSKADKFFQMFESRKTVEIDGRKFTIERRSHEDELNRPNIKLLDIVRTNYQDRVTTYKASVFHKNKDQIILFEMFKSHEFIKDDFTHSFSKWTQMIETLSSHENFLKIEMIEVKRPYIGIGKEFVKYNLYEVLKSGKLSSFETKVSILCEICKGMMYLSSRRKQEIFNFPIFLSPNNLHFTDDLKVKIDCSSFGFITGGNLSEQDFHDPFIDKEKNEDEEGEEGEGTYYDERSDIVSFGLVMVVMLTNEKLKFADSDGSWNLPVIEEVETRQHRCMEEVEWYIGLMKKCYCSDPSKRPQSFDQILECLKKKDLSGL